LGKSGSHPWGKDVLGKVWSQITIGGIGELDRPSYIGDVAPPQAEITQQIMVFSGTYLTDSTINNPIKGEVSCVFSSRLT
jgi:hypothetical protein